MSQQLNLLGEPAVERPRAPRQDAVLELLARHPEGCTADEIGAAIHAARGKHDADELCAFCSIDSRDVLRALEKKQLIRRTVHGQFCLRMSEEKTGGPGEEIPY